MDRSLSDESYVDALSRRSIELSEKADKAETEEARVALRDLAKLYADMAASVRELERLRNRAGKTF